MSILSQILVWFSHKLYIWGAKGAAIWIIRRLYNSTQLSEIYREVAEVVLAKLYKGDDKGLAANRELIMMEYAEYLLTEKRNHNQLSAVTLAFEDKFNELLAKEYPAASMWFEAHKAAKREDVSLALLEEIRAMVKNLPGQMPALTKQEMHDVASFKAFDKDYSEEKLNYSLYRISHATKYSEYDLQIWYGLKHWLEQTSNSFINEDIQTKGQQLLKEMNGLLVFTSLNYFIDHNNWCSKDDSNVSDAEWREINEARIYKWEPDVWDPKLYNERESIIMKGISEHIPAVEKAYQEFRIAVKKNLGV